jgi:hypothetical protein
MEECLEVAGKWPGRFSVCARRRNALRALPPTRPLEAARRHTNERIALENQISTVAAALTDASTVGGTR